MALSKNDYNRRWFLCHGVCIGTGPNNKGKRIGHAWVENMLLVIDASGRVVNKDLYYKAGQVANVERYNFDEALAKADKTEIYGPWNKAIWQAEKWRIPILNP